MARFVLLWTMVLLGFWPHTALADKRVALVIGNGAYLNVPQLPNPTRDAEAIADLLRTRAGFEVVQVHNNLKSQDFMLALRAFKKVAADADIALVFYAGHAIQLRETNYMVAVDATLDDEDDAEQWNQAIPLDLILGAARAKRLGVVILDACRDNPFIRKMRTRGVLPTKAGLAPTAPIKDEGDHGDTLIVYATASGLVAADGDGEHSPFTEALLKHLAEPGLDIRRMFGKVRDEVRQKTGREQIPYYYATLGGEEIALVPAPAKPDAPGLADPEEDLLVQRLLRQFREEKDAAKRKAAEQALKAAEEKRRADEQRAQQEAEAKRKAEAEALEAKRKADAEQAAEEKRKADKQRVQQEAEAKRKADEQRAQQEAEAKRKAEAEALEAKRKADAEVAEAKRKADAEQAAEEKRKADEQRAQQEAEAKRKADAEVAEAKRKADAEQAAEEKRKADEQRAQQEAEAKRKAEVEAAEAKRKAEGVQAAEATRNGDPGAQREAEAKKAEQAVAERKAEVEAAEEKRKADEQRAQQEAAKRQAEAEAEAKRKAEAEAEAKRQAEAEAEAKRKAEAEAEAKHNAEQEQPPNAASVPASSPSADSAAATPNPGSVAEATPPAPVQTETVTTPPAMPAPLPPAGDADKKTQLAAINSAQSPTDLRPLDSTDDRSHLPIDGQRIEYLKQVQTALKGYNCYEGTINGDVDDAREALERFAKSYKGVARQVDPTSATIADYEGWLSWFKGLEKFACPSEEPSGRADKTTRKKKRPREEVETTKERRTPKKEASPRSKPTREVRRQPSRQPSRQPRSYAPARGSGGGGTMGGTGF